MLERRTAELEPHERIGQMPVRRVGGPRYGRGRPLVRDQPVQQRRERGGGLGSQGVPGDEPRKAAGWVGLSRIHSLRSSVKVSRETLRARPFHVKRAAYASYSLPRETGETTR